MKKSSLKFPIRKYVKIKHVAVLLANACLLCHGINESDANIVWSRAATGERNIGLWIAFKQLRNMITFIFCLQSGFTPKFLFIFMRAEVN